VEPSNEPHEIVAAGAGPILVIGTTGDPATPYESSVRLADSLESGVLLTFRGDGHTAYEQGNICVDDHVDAYILTGETPPEGTEC
jgi:pimeloyl-ACP methyl ester carboxylesterase